DRRGQLPVLEEISIEIADRDQAAVSIRGRVVEADVEVAGAAALLEGEEAEARVENADADRGRDRVALLVKPQGLAVVCQVRSNALLQAVRAVLPGVFGVPTRRRVVEVSVGDLGVVLVVA